MKLINFFTLVTFFALAESQVGRGRMFDGLDVPERKFTSLVRLLSYSGLAVWPCTATIINKTWIMTAAHCVTKDGVVANFIVAYMGSPIKESTYEKYVVLKNAKTKVYIHDNYNIGGRHENDIALIKTPQIPLSENITIASLPDKRPSIEAPVKFAGWGTLSEAGVKASIAQWNDFIVATNYFCLNRIKGIMDDNQLCLFSADSQICNGDSGGGAYDGTTVVGIASLGSGKGCEVSDPAVFTSVFDHMEWIKEIISKFSDEKPC